MLIGTKSIATLSTGYLNALEFAKERRQGADLTKATDKTAPRVEIIRHPDVRRMLMLQKSHAEGMRALLYYTSWVQDQKELDPDNEYMERLDDLLLPLVKGYSSEKAYELLAQSLQVLGGSGFTTDYPIEQYIRDSKIDTVYEAPPASRRSICSSARSPATRARRTWRSPRRSRRGEGWSRGTSRTSVRCSVPRWRKPRHTSG